MARKQLFKSCFLFTQFCMYPNIEFLSRQIPTYGICLLTAIVFVVSLSTISAKKVGYTFYDLLIVGGFTLLFALPFGSILYAIVTYNFTQIINYVIEGNFNAFGGLVFYGAFIGGVFGAVLGVRIAKLNLGIIEKIVVPYIPIGHAIGRIGCLLAGCCYGMEYNGPCAVYYQNSIAGVSCEIGHFPVQIIEAFLNVGVFLFLLLMSKKVKKRFELLSIYMILYGIIRFLLEFLRGDKIRGIYFSFSTSQWISLALILLGCRYFIYLKLHPSKN